MEDTPLGAVKRERGVSVAPSRATRTCHGIAAMQHRSMSTTLTLSKRGSLTLPPDLRRKLGLDKLRHPMLLVEERDGGLFLQPAVALPVRDLPKEQMKAWIARDEAEMRAYRTSGKSRKK